MTAQTCALCLVGVLTVHPLTNPETLEPSVRNEVDHALSIVPEGSDVPLSDAAEEFAWLYATNGLTVTARAIALVSSQKNGCWYWRGTNVTPVAVWLLLRTADDPDCAASTNVAAFVRRVLRKRGKVRP